MSESSAIQRAVIEGPVPGPHLLVTGGVHGDEFEPMVATRRLICEVDSQVLRGKLTLIPVVNESAFRRQHRCGEDNLDLARTCPGRADGSVTERTAASLSRLIRSADYYIDLHTGGTTMCVSPLAGYMLHKDAQVLAKQRAMARAFNLPIIWGTSVEFQGRSLSVARDAGVPAIYCEYLGAATCQNHGVEAYVEGCLNVMGVLGMIRRQQGPSRIVHIVEDGRPQSGYMQIQNPAPIEGYFEVQVQLGQWLDAGDLLGTVCDELGGVRREVRSTHAGIVLTLRTFPRVEQGDGLAVILDVSNSGENHE